MPNANISTSSAHTTPMISLGPVLISLSAGVELSAGTTSSPACPAGSAASDRACVVSASLVLSCPSMRTVISPIRRLEAMPPLRYGDVDLHDVRHRADAGPTARSTACLRPSSMSGPFGE